MDLFQDLLVSTITLGALYAASSVALSLLWGSVGVLNLAHGAFMTIGAYASLLSVTRWGLPWWLGIVAGAAGGALAGLVTTVALIRWVFAKPNFEINVIILTMALASIVIDLINNIVGPNTARQPFNVTGRIDFGSSGVAYQTILIVLASALMVGTLHLLMTRSSLGRTIRAVAQEPVAAQLNGVPIGIIVLKTMVLAGTIAGISGVLLSAWSSVYPALGADPLLKALIICVVGGLGSIPGALLASFAMAALEVSVQYGFGSKWGLPALLMSVIVVLVARPSGLMGRKLESRH